jgi:hypothetical protein
MAAYFVQTCYVCVWHTVENAQSAPHTHTHTHTHTHARITGLNKICRHNSENVYNDTYTGTRDVILAKRWLWLPDGGLCKQKHVGAAFIILIVLII